MSDDEEVQINKDEFPLLFGTDEQVNKKLDEVEKELKEEQERKEFLKWNF